MSQHLTNKQNSLPPHGREIPLYNFHPSSVKKKQPRAFFTFSRIGMLWRPKGVCQRKKGVQGGCQGEKSLLSSFAFTCSFSKKSQESGGLSQVEFQNSW
jgi:hypothetical protein